VLRASQAQEWWKMMEFERLGNVLTQTFDLARIDAVKEHRILSFAILATLKSSRF
jgi:hypothetical protein